MKECVCLGSTACADSSSSSSSSSSNNNNGTTKDATSAKVSYEMDVCPFDACDSDQTFFFVLWCDLCLADYCDSGADAAAIASAALIPQPNRALGIGYKVDVFGALVGEDPASIAEMRYTGNTATI